MYTAAAFRRSFGIARRSSSAVGSAFVSSSAQQRQQRRVDGSSSLNERKAGFAPHHSTLLHPTSSALFSSTTKDDSTSISDKYDISNVPADYDLTNAAAGLSGTSYDPTTFETSVYQWWESTGCFDPDAKQPASEALGEPYVLPMPPPNVTGRLHMGHAMFVALQDGLARFHRMRGRPVLWTPGTDHAGIATQLQVEKALMAEGKRRGTPEEIALATTEEEKSKLVGREEFLEKVWEYKEEQGGAITYQLRALGASAD